MDLAGSCSDNDIANRNRAATSGEAFALESMSRINGASEETAERLAFLLPALSISATTMLDQANRASGASRVASVIRGCSKSRGAMSTSGRSPALYARHSVTRLDRAREASRL